MTPAPGGPEPYPDAGGSAGGTCMELDRTPAALRAEIERTRAALGETVDALAAKPDVRALVPGAPVPGALDAGALDAGALDTGEAVRPVAAGPPPVAPNRYCELAYRAGRSRERISGAIGTRWPVLAAAGCLVLLFAGRRRGVLPLAGRRRGARPLTGRGARRRHGDAA